MSFNKLLEEVLNEKGPPLFKKGEKVYFINRYKVKVKGTIDRFSERDRKWVVIRDADSNEVLVQKPIRL